MSDESTFSRLCGCSFIHPQRTLREGLQLVKSLGLTHVDIGVGGGNAHFDPIEVAENPAQFADEVRRETEHFSLTPNECFTLNFGVPINTPDANERQKTRSLFRGLCNFAKRAQCKSILLIPGPIYPDLGASLSLDLAALALTDLVSIADEYNVQLNIEADYESCANTPEAAKELCERVPGLGLTLDYSHFIYQKIPPEKVAILHPYTRHIHIRQATPGNIVTDVDDGIIDYTNVISQLEKLGYNGLYCIEYLSLDADKRTFAISEKRTQNMICKMQKIFTGLTNA
jgi:sugar phosphate isomerase/epimerase